MRKKAKLSFDSGTVMIGKWNRNEYTIIRRIGSGMIGTVYLCRTKGRLAALKISASPMSLTREVTILKIFNKVRDHRLGPFLIDVDDWEGYHQTGYSFYVMEYINGIDMTDFIKRQGPDWVGTCIIQMLETLEKLHQTGFVFGDLKNSNILITQQEPKVRFIDVGGVTKFGQSVKEYSNFYDRAYWHLGTRKAEVQYDLFALVMVFVSIYYPKQFSRSKHPAQQIIRHIQHVPSLRVYQHSFRKALIGGYPSAKAMKMDIKKIITNEEKKKVRQKESYVPQAFMISLIAGVYYLLSLLTL